MMVGKQWVKSWGMYRWAVEASTYCGWRKQTAIRVARQRALQLETLTFHYKNK